MYLCSKLNKCNLLPDVVSKNCWMSGDQCKPCSVVSYLGLHCLLRPVCPIQIHKHRKIFLWEDKGRYPVNIFLISPRKHMLWVLIRSASMSENICCGYSLEVPRLIEALLMSTHNICFHGEIRKISILLD